MKVTVLLFGHFRDLAGVEGMTLEMSETATLKDLVDELENQNSALKDISKHCRFAINEEFAPLHMKLSEDDVVAVLPPMSGG